MGWRRLRVAQKVADAMMAESTSKVQHGYLVIGDISGYTSFLAGTELDHAHQILTELLETIVNRFKTLLTISKIEGDAVFAYVAETQMQTGETLLELIESTYVAFRDCQANMHRKTTCTCQACRSIPMLDLKFIAHHGDYIQQPVAGITELAGSDVNLIHRLLKNHVAEATGWRAYALFTERSLEHMALSLQGAHEQPEAYEHLGVVQTYSLDLRKRHDEIISTRRIYISREEADYAVIQDFDGPPAAVWEWMTDIKLRNIWSEGHGVWSERSLPTGRTGVGTQSHCAHGKGKGDAFETFLDWRPFDYYTAETNDNGTVLKETIQLELLPDGKTTRMYDNMQVKMPLPTPLRKAALAFMMNWVIKYPEVMANAARLFAEYHAQKNSEATVTA